MTCRENEVDRFRYLSYVFEHLPMATTVEAPEALLPWNMQPILEGRRKRKGAIACLDMRERKLLLANAPLFQGWCRDYPVN